MMRNISTLKEYDGTNGKEIFEQLRAQLTGGGQCRLILTKGMSSGYLQNLMFRLGIPGAVDLIMVPQEEAVVKPGEEVLAINASEKKVLLSLGVLFVREHSEIVTAFPVASTFSFVMPFFSQETQLVPFISILAICLMVNMQLAPYLDGARYPQRGYLNKSNAMVVGLQLGIATFSSMIESPPLYRALAVGGVVASWVSGNAYMSRKDITAIAMTFAGTSVEVFGVVATLHQISEQLGDKSALAIITKMAAAMLIITQRGNVCSLACNAIGSLWHNPRQNEGPVDIENRGEVQVSSGEGCSSS